jgi:CubicO group peptidase (beta-lactamase class C family)
MAMARSTGSLVHGGVEEGFGAVADAFRRNLDERDELGAACAVYLGDRAVVDVWGGHRDRRRSHPWARDTIVPVFSATKGVAAMAMAVAHSRGLFRLDEPIASYWPEFARHGKERITVRHLLTHQAGLAAIDVPLSLDLLADAERLGEVLAAQVPRWEPGQRHGYHGQSLGWYQNQLMRRIDPGHRTVGRFVADEIAGPLGLELHIGLPDAVPDERLAEVVDGGMVAALTHLNEPPLAFLIGLMNPWSLTHRVFRNPRCLARLSDINRRELLRLDHPSVMGVGTARALARAYVCFAGGGDELGIDRGTIEQLEAPAPIPEGGRRDLVFKDETAYGFGFMKPVGGQRFGSSDRAYGHDGIGGSMAFADPDRNLGYAYVMNRTGFSWIADPRELALRRAVTSVLE